MSRLENTDEIKKIEKDLDENREYAINDKGIEIEYLVEGAILVCNKGDHSCFLLLNEDHGVYETNGKNFMNIKDCEVGTNITFFGDCEASGELCDPKFKIWDNGNKKKRVGGEESLTMESFLKCLKHADGIVTPLVSGQQHVNLLELIKQAVRDKNMPMIASLLMNRYDDGSGVNFFDRILQGKKLSCLYVSDPVNSATGNFIYEMTDVGVRGLVPLVFTRFYNARGDRVTNVGEKWTHNFNISLTAHRDVVAITFEDGHMDVYMKMNDGSFSPIIASEATLEEDQRGFTLQTEKLESLRFNKEGQLIEQKDRNGKSIQLSYKDGNLDEVKSVSGSLHFLYNEGNFIESIEDHTGRIVRFSYEKGCLVKAIHAMGEEFKYKYLDTGLMIEMESPVGNKTVTSQYDGDQRATVQTFADGSVVSMEYDDDEMKTKTTEQNGNVITYHRDADYRTIMEESTDGYKKFTYNAKSKMTSFIDKKGNKYEYKYDADGHLIRATNPLGHVQKMAYNEHGQLLMYILPNDGAYRYTYDENGNLLTSSDPLSRDVNYTYSGDGRILSYTLPDGGEVKLEYDRRGNAIAVTDQLGNKTCYGYDDLNRVISSKKANGGVSSFTYNEAGKIIKAVNAEGNEQTFAYNPAGLMTKVYDYNGGVIEYKYNELNYPDTIIDQMGGETKYKYDEMGKLSCVTNPNGDATKYKYDTHHNLISIEDPEGNISCFEYDVNSNVTAVTTPSGKKVEYRYDALDRKIETILPNGSKTKQYYNKIGKIIKVENGEQILTAHYDLAGQLIETIDPLGNATKFTYTVLGQIESITKPGGQVIQYEYYIGGRMKRIYSTDGGSESYEYDQCGNTCKTINSSGVETKFEYDVMNRLSKTIDGLGNEQHFFYDKTGKVIEVVDVNGNSTQYEYSALGDVIEITDALKNKTKITYDKMRRIKEIEQYCSISDTWTTEKKLTAQITKFTHDKNGKIIKVEDPLGQSIEYKYDCDGQHIATLNELGDETEYLYNQLGMLEEIKYPDEKNVSMYYNELNQLEEVHDWLGTTRIENDLLGRIIKTTDYNNETVQYKWDADFKKTGIIYPDNTEVNYIYNRSGQLTHIHTPTEKIEYEYDHQHKLSKMIRPDNLVTEYSYDILGRLNEIVNKSNGNILDQISYTFDPASNIIQITKTRSGELQDSGIFTYEYDALNQLTQAKTPVGTRKYSFDEMGNRIAMKKNGEEIIYSYDLLNRLTSKRGNRMLEYYEYDGRGNLIAIRNNRGDKNRFTYNAANRLVNIENENGNQIENIYDGLGRRVAQKNMMQNGDKTRTDFISDHMSKRNNILMSKGNHTERYIWDDTILSAYKGSERIDIFHDHLGSPIRNINHKGESELQSYDEFGQIIHKSENLQNLPYSFAGYMAEATIDNLYYAQARYYDASDARMLGKDPMRLQTRRLVPGQFGLAPHSLNPFLYCRNHPLTAIDYNGCFLRGLINDATNYLVEKGSDFIDGVAEVASNTIDAISDAYENSNVKKAVDWVVEEAKEVPNFIQNFQGIDKTSGDSIDRSIHEIPFVGDIYAWIQEESAAGATLPGFENYVYEGADARISRVDAIQKVFGYNKFYDWVFGEATDIRTARMIFEVGGVEYMIQPWQAYYLNMGSGGEVGFYRKSRFPGHYVVDETLNMSVTMYDLHGNEFLASGDIEHWWTAIFRNDAKLTGSQMVTQFEVDMENKEMTDGYKGALKSGDLKYTWTVDPTNRNNVIAALGPADPKF